MTTSNKISCPRCGGSGKTEHTHVVEGTCFMCYGFGEVLPQRVGELTEKAKTRKANKESKIQAIYAEQKIQEENRWDLYHVWQNAKNVIYFNNKKEQATTVSDSLINKINGISNIVLNDNSTESEVREMLSNYFKDASYLFKYQVSKWTLENYNFSFMVIPDDYDLELGSGIIHIFESEQTN
jgi:DnaJ-class molecular chaperone